MRCVATSPFGAMRGFAMVAAIAATAGAAHATPSRPVHTYSIVARDAATGELGAAVQSHWFSVGPLVPWAEAGVGAVATQSFVDRNSSPGPVSTHVI